MGLINRREFIGLGLLSPLVFQSAFHFFSGSTARFFFTSQGSMAMMSADGSGLQYFTFDRPEQVSWQPVAFFPGGEKVLLLSMEKRRDGPGKPFSIYYTQTPTHIWSYELQSGQLTELATKERRAVFYTPSLLIGSDRMLVQVARNSTVQLFNMKLDGTDAQPFTAPNEGDPYGLSLNPAKDKVAFHMATPEGYQVFISDVNGKNRVRIIGKQGHLYFGTSWSPDGKWILYVDCHETEDPGHDWADICISRSDGSEHRILTSGQSMWFASSYGDKLAHGNGSNVPCWSKSGTIIFPRKLPGSKVPMVYKPERPDTDHFNRDYNPEQAVGGVEISELNIDSGDIKALTHQGEGVWDFRASQSPDGSHIVFCRAKTGEMPAIWIMKSNGDDQRKLTAGVNGKGADQPRWLPVKER